jgi:hypothetical protein
LYILPVNTLGKVWLLRGSTLQVLALLLLLIMLLLYADCMLLSCSVEKRARNLDEEQRLVGAGLKAATCLKRTVLLRDKIPSIEGRTQLSY